MAYRAGQPSWLCAPPARVSTTPSRWRITARLRSGLWLTARSQTGCSPRCGWRCAASARVELCLRLDRRDGNGVDDVVDGGAARQVVDRTAQALHDRTDRDGTRRALHGL